jgi:hypothetical protein
LQVEPYSFQSASLHLLNAYRHQPHYILFSLIPILFALQQLIEHLAYKKRLMRHAGVLGILLAFALYIPMFFNPHALEVSVAKHSICYSGQFSHSKLLAAKAASFQY